MHRFMCVVLVSTLLGICMVSFTTMASAGTHFQAKQLPHRWLATQMGHRPYSGLNKHGSQRLSSQMRHAIHNPSMHKFDLFDVMRCTRGSCSTPFPQQPLGRALSILKSGVTVLVVWIAVKCLWLIRPMVTSPKLLLHPQHMVALSFGGSQPQQPNQNPTQILAHLRSALHPGARASSDAVWQVSCQTSIMGMQGNSTLTWQPYDANVKREVDCTACVPVGPDPLIHTIAIAMSCLASSSPSTVTLEPSTDSYGTLGGEGASALTAFDPACVCWEREWSGLTTELELEDAESAALGLWLCTGQWVSLVDLGILAFSVPDTAPDYRTIKFPISPTPAPDVEILHQWISLNVIGGRIHADVLVNSDTWLPRLAYIRLSDGLAAWTFDDWAQYGPVCLPKHVTYTAPSQLPIVHQILSDSLHPVSSRSLWLQCPVPLSNSLLGPRYSSPDIFRRPGNPLGAWYDDWGAPSEFPIWQGEGGHLFCEPTVGGEVIGLFIIDTGTDCLVIDPDAFSPTLAAKCQRFAAHTILGLGGTPMQTGLVRSLGPLIVGPLMLERPVFREACLTGVARPPSNAGPAPRIAGILGYDFFRHCRLELLLNQGNLTMKIRRPGGLIPPRQALGWQTARFLRRIPHLKVTISPLAQNSEQVSLEAAIGLGVTADAQNQRGLFRLALGTGGTRLILGSGISDRLGLNAPEVSALLPSGTVSAPAGNSSLMARLQQLRDGARLIPLRQVAFPGVVFDNALALCHADDDTADLELSCYADGVLGALLFPNCSLVIDYSTRRISITSLR